MAMPRAAHITKPQAVRDICGEVRVRCDGVRDGDGRPIRTRHGRVLMRPTHSTAAAVLAAPDRGCRSCYMVGSPAQTGRCSIRKQAG